MILREALPLFCFNHLFLDFSYFEYPKIGSRVKGNPRGPRHRPILSGHLKELSSHSNRILEAVHGAFVPNTSHNYLCGFGYQTIIFMVTWHPLSLYFTHKAFQ